jgi:exonuclease SbcD
LSDKHIYFYGAFDGTVHKVILTDEYGDVNFWLLPFIKPASVYGLFEDKKIESYDDVIMTAIEAADIDYSARNVLISHQFYTKTGVKPDQSDSELNLVGGLDAVNSEIIEGFDYVALGHLHRKQGVGSEHICYCGSPIKYSFSEWQHEKFVTLAELSEKGNLSIEYLPLSPLHDMREIRGELDTLISDEVSSLADREDYLRVILTDEAELIDPMGRLRSVYPNIMDLGYENSKTSIDISDIKADIDAIKKLSVYELFGEFFLDVQGTTMSIEQAEIVNELLEMVDEE